RRLGVACRNANRNRALNRGQIERAGSLISSPSFAGAKVCFDRSGTRCPAKRWAKTGRRGTKEGFNDWHVLEKDRPYFEETLRALKFQSSLIRLTLSRGGTFIVLNLDSRTRPGAAPFGLDRNFRGV